VVERLDGPDSRVFELIVRGENITLVHDDLLGNRFFAKTASAEPLVRELAEGLLQALTNGA
jgi:hypothetical protein